jgi:hypothetical protein
LQTVTESNVQQASAFESFRFEGFSEVDHAESSDHTSSYTGSVGIAYFYKNSVSTPGYGVGQKSVTVRISKRKIDLDEYLREPVKPVYNPPKTKLRKPPVKPDWYTLPVRKKIFNRLKAQYPGETNAAMQRRVKIELQINEKRNIKFLAKMKNWQSWDDLRIRRLAHYDSQFKQRIKKYEKRVAIRLKRLEIVKNWQSTSARLKKFRGGTLPENGYERIKITAQTGNPFHGATHVRECYYSSSLPLFIHGHMEYCRYWRVLMTSVTNHSVDTVHCRNFASHVMSSLQEERDFIGLKTSAKITLN